MLEKTTVGRAGQNTLVIADGSVSGTHCEILVNGPAVIVRDLGSHNGTWVNGARLVNQQAQLKSGQTVRFGSVEARLDLGEPSFDETASEMTAVRAVERIARDQRREEKRPKPADPSMKLESPDSGADDDRTVTTRKISPATKSPVPAASAAAPAAHEPGKSSGKTAIVVVTTLILGLIAFLWFWWSRK